MCEKINLMSNTNKDLNNRKRNERGAALVMTLLITTLLLGFCGALLMTTSGTAANTFNSTAEMQAYYAAETGLQATLDVLRGNVAPVDPLLASSNTKISFRNAITPAKSNYFGDPATFARLSGWLAYDTTNTDRIKITPVYTMSRGVAYSVIISTADNVEAGFEPKKVLVQVTGYGPNNAVKKMEMVVVKAFTGNFTAPATLTLIGSPTTPATVAVGNSNASTYTGVDQAVLTKSYPAIAVTTNTDLTAVQTSIATSNTTVSPTPAVISNSTLPTYLQSADAARNTLNDLQSIAESTERYYTTATQPTEVGSPTQPKFTFVDGDLELSSSVGVGAGLLVVTGTLTLNGNYSFQGLILVLGGGQVLRSGGGGGTLEGAMVVAKFDRTAYETPFLAPTYDTSGGGNSTLAYNSLYAAQAIGMTVRRPLGIVER